MYFHVEERFENKRSWFSGTTKKDWGGVGKGIVEGAIFWGDGKNAIINGQSVGFEVR